MIVNINDSLLECGVSTVASLHFGIDHLCLRLMIFVERNVRYILPVEFSVNIAKILSTSVPGLWETGYCSSPLRYSIPLRTAARLTFHRHVENGSEEGTKLARSVEESYSSKLS